MVVGSSPTWGVSFSPLLLATFSDSDLAFIYPPSSLSRDWSFDWSPYQTKNLDLFAFSPAHTLFLKDYQLNRYSGCHWKFA